MGITGKKKRHCTGRERDIRHKGREEKERKGKMQNNPVYGHRKEAPSSVDPMQSMSHEQPMQSLTNRKGEASPDSEEVDMDIAPLLHSEMHKVHGRTRCQTCAIITQTVLLTCIGLVIIAGVLVINWRFAILNEELGSIAYTGELARPLLEDAGQLTQNFNNLTDSLGGDLGILGNDSLASGVRDFTSQIADAGRQLFDGLTDTISNAGQDRTARTNSTDTDTDADGVTSQPTDSNAG